jgi:xylulokinase
MAYLLSIDIGTSSAKTIVLEAENARTIANATHEYPILKPRLGYVEQNPEDWWQAAIVTVRQALTISQVDPTSILGIGLSGQMHGTVCLDKEGCHVRPAIIWADTRSITEIDQVTKRASSQEMALYAPGPPATGFMGLTLSWLRRHEPETLAATYQVVLPKDFVRQKLTGKIATDISDAAATWLLDINSGEWSAWLLDLCQVERRIMPPIIGSWEVAGKLNASSAQILGLPTDIPVVTGCADQSAQALGYGIVDPGIALVTIGTGGQVFLPLSAPKTDPEMRFHVLNHAVPNRWYALAAILSAGLSLRWLRDLLGLTDRTDAYAHLSELAAQTAPGADGLVFLPYLAGERTPHLDSSASGVFVGLRLQHSRGHLARAVMEGVTFALAECLSLARGLSEDDQLKIIASGGATSSPVWLQILSDIFNTPLMLTEGQNHACIGAALLAGVGCGIYSSLADACALLPQPTVRVEPVTARASFYAERFTLYRELYNHLKDDMHKLSRHNQL